MSLNLNWQERDKILGIENDSTIRPRNSNYHGGCANYRGLTVEGLKELIDKDFIREDEYQNSAPTVKEFYEFMKQHSNFTAHGYSVEEKRWMRQLR